MSPNYYRKIKKDLVKIFFLNVHKKVITRKQKINCKEIKKKLLHIASKICHVCDLVKH